MTAKLTPKDTVDDIMTIFELFDQDRTYTFLRQLAECREDNRCKKTPQQIQGMLSTLDTDQDGELDPIDFYTCLVTHNA